MGFTSHIIVFLHTLFLMFYTWLSLFTFLAVQIQCYLILDRKPFSSGEEAFGFFFIVFDFIFLFIDIYCAFKAYRVFKYASQNSIQPQNRVDRSDGPNGFQRNRNDNRQPLLDDERDQRDHS